MKLIVVNLRAKFDETLVEYLKPRTWTEKMYTNLQIQTENLGRISRSSTESLNSRPRVSDVRPDI